MNFTFNKPTDNTGKKLAIARGVTNQRTIARDVISSGRKAPVTPQYTSLGRMGVDRDRFNIYETGSSNRSEEKDAHLMKVGLEDIKGYQTIGTHAREPDALPDIGGTSWLNINERKSIHAHDAGPDKPVVNITDKQEGLISSLQSRVDKMKQETQDGKDVMKARLIEIKAQEESVKEQITEETARYEETKAQQSSITLKLEEEIERQKQAEEELAIMKTKIRENERLEAERLEAERLEAERLEAERLEMERLEAERLEAERLEAERLEAERLEAERLEAERLEAERLEAERLEAERLEAERLEAERLEAERLEAERLEAERVEREKMIKYPEYEIEIKKKQLSDLESMIAKGKAEQERLRERQKLEVYLFACYHGIILDYIVEQYQKAYPSADITVCDNHTISLEQQERLRHLGCTIIQYGSQSDDLDYEMRSAMYNTVWRKNDDEAWVIIAPADTFINVSEKKIKNLNDADSNTVDTHGYTMVSKSTKKDLSDIRMKDINTGYRSDCKDYVFFNKSLKPDVVYNLDSNQITLCSEIESRCKVKECNAYSYIYMGLGFYVSRSRQIYAREKRWRDKGCMTCFEYDINAISSKILSLPATQYLNKMK